MNQATDNQKCNVYFFVQSRPGDDPDADWIDKKGRVVKDVPVDREYIDFDAMRMDTIISLIGGCQLLAEQFVDAAREDFHNRFDWEYTKTDVFARAMRSLQMPVDRIMAFKESYDSKGEVVYRFTIQIEE